MPELAEEPYTPSPPTVPTDADQTVSEQSLAAEAAFVFIRKFESVSHFMEKVRSLDTVLENIESFSSEVRRINKSGINIEGTPSDSANIRLPTYSSPSTNLIHEELDVAEEDESPMGSEMVEVADNSSE